MSHEYGAVTVGSEAPARQDMCRGQSRYFRLALARARQRYDVIGDLPCRLGVVTHLFTAHPGTAEGRVGSVGDWCPLARPGRDSGEVILCDSLLGGQLPQQARQLDALVPDQRAPDLVLMAASGRPHLAQLLPALCGQV